MSSVPTAGLALGSAPDLATGRTKPSLLAWGAVVAFIPTIFAGHFDSITGPIPLDRVALFIFLALAASRLRVGVRFRPGILEIALVSQAILIAASSLYAGTFTEPTYFFLWLDQAVIPAALFLLAPIAFRSDADRLLLLRAIVLAALYVGFESVAQSFNLNGLVFPRYLLSTTEPGAVSRATGPSLQVGGNGAMLTMSIAAILLLLQRSSGLWRYISALSLLAASAGAFLTLTRSVWLAWFAAIAIYVVTDRRIRAAGTVFAGVIVLGLLVAVALSPALSAATTSRLETTKSIDDRTTTNAAAVDMFNTYPVTGVGWGQFLPQIDRWVEQQDLVPLTNTHIVAHNVILSRAAELGVLGVGLLLLTLCLGPLRGTVSKRAAPDTEWRRVLAATFVAWFYIAMLTPMGYAYSNYLLWLLTGLALRPPALTLDGANHGPRSPDPRLNRLRSLAHRLRLVRRAGER